MKTQVISQEEIDKLLTAITNDDTEPEDIRPSADTRWIKIYDFKRPSVFSKNIIRELSFLHDLLASSWEAIFSHYCGGKAHIHVESVDSLTLEEFIRSVPTPTSLIISQGIINSVPIQTPFIIEIDPAIYHNILYHLFLGKTDGYEEYIDTIPNYRRVTSLDKAALQYFSNLLLKKYSQNWNRKYGPGTEFYFKFLETNPGYIDIVPSYEMVVLITMEVNIQNTKGMINICLPHSFLRKVFPHLFWGKNYKASKENKEIILHPIPKYIKDKMLLMLKAEYFRQIVSVKDLVNIKVGDVLYAPHSLEKKGCKLLSDDLVLFGGSIAGNNSNLNTFRQLKVSEVFYPYKEADFMTDRDMLTVEANLDELKVQVIVEIGRTVQTLKEISETKEGAIINLDTFVCEPVSIFANNVLFARGEVIVEDEKFGVRVCEILGQESKAPEPVIKEETEENDNSAAI